MEEEKGMGPVRKKQLQIQEMVNVPSVGEVKTETLQKKSKLKSLTELEKAYLEGLSEEELLYLESLKKKIARLWSGDALVE